MGHVLGTAASPRRPGTPRPKFVLENEEGEVADASESVFMHDPLEDEEDTERQAREEEESRDAENRHEEEEKKVNATVGPIKGMSPQQIEAVDGLLRLAQTSIAGSRIHIPDGIRMIAVDLETTGLFIKGKDPPRITELAAVSLSNPSEFISCLVKLPPSVTIHPMAKKVSGIDEKMCADFGVHEDEALLALVVFIQAQIDKYKAKKVYLVAHNAFGFDAKLITQMFHRQNFHTTLDLSKVFWVDSLMAARASTAETRGHDAQNALGSLMKTDFPNLDAKALHRALADCLALCALIHSNRANMFDSLFVGDAAIKFEEFGKK